MKTILNMDNKKQMAENFYACSLCYTVWPVDGNEDDSNPGL
jgi:hypothetical protein